MDMEYNQLIQYDQNLAACYETEYLLSMKVEDQDFYDYPDISEVSTRYALPKPSTSEAPIMCGNDDMEIDTTISYSQAQVQQNQSRCSTSSSDINVNNGVCIQSTAVGEHSKNAMVCMDEEHSDGPNRKKKCLRQSES